MKRYLLLLIALSLGFSVKLLGQAELQIDTTFPIQVKAPNGLKAGDGLYVTYGIINIGSTSSKPIDTITTHFNINGVTLGETRYFIKRSIKPYFTTKDRDTVFTGFALPQNFVSPASGSSVVIVIWPTGNGVAFTVHPNHDTLIFTYTAIAPMMQAPDFLKIYPNPAEDIIHFDIQNSNLQVRKISITDMTGREVTQWIRYDNTLDVNMLPIGCYILNLQFSDGSIGRYKMMRGTR